MKSSFKARAAAMLASVAITFVMVQGVALVGHPAGPTVTEAGQIAGFTVRAGAS